MQRVRSLAILLAALGFTGAAAFGIAYAAEDAFDVSAVIAPSAPAGLLPPITIEGRKGWTCAAERSATAADLAGAALPNTK